ncbi:MAG: DnaJ domain-containing protein [Deltaproteobacteria bacterium]|nr:DnaJ domain-containing protein [Deltaproteobacteria bacterium]
MELYVPDHYRVLGVPVTADASAIREAYRKLSRVYHPDRHGGSARATCCFQFISSAHTELSDPLRRLNYDRQLLLSDPLRMVDDPRAARALDVLELVVRRIRRQPEALPGAARGRDLRVRHTVPFRVAALGGTTMVAVSYDSVCGGCRGQGTTEPARNPVCHVCQGQGTVKHGLRRANDECAFCAGRGAVLLACCADCGGRGLARIDRQIGVAVPPRAHPGLVLRARGMGETPALGTQPGDLVVELDVAPHPVLEVQGDDLLACVPVTWLQAVAGGTLQVPTLEGTERLTLPTDMAGRRELRIAHRGLPRPDGSRGALRVRLSVDVPTALGADDVAAVAQMQQRWGDGAFAAVTDYARKLDACSDPPA